LSKTLWKELLVTHQNNIAMFWFEIWDIRVENFCSNSNKSLDLWESEP